MGKNICIIGGGAAGFFAAVNHAALFPQNKVTLFEKSNKFLAKVKISGGGRCNVTHACFDPQELVSYYPRGAKELLGPFHHFNCGHTIEWFADRGVELHTEEDERMFPITNSSQTIIDCLVNEAIKHHVDILLNENVMELEKVNEQWNVRTSSGEHVFDVILLATGSSPMAWEMLKATGHTIVEPAPSLFTFIIKHPVLTNLQGISLPHASVRIHNTQTTCEGPMLITHVGLSGPAVLKLSAFGAVDFYKTNYITRLLIDFTGHGKDYVSGAIKETREAWGNKKVKNSPLFNLPQRLWTSLVEFAGIDEKNWADLNRKTIDTLVTSICALEVETSGKNTFKEEFVTAGGIDLGEVNMKTMESKKVPGLFFAGEVLNIDAVTGGFNFQAAWTTGYLAAQGMGKNGH